MEPRAMVGRKPARRPQVVRSLAQPLPQDQKPLTEGPQLLKQVCGTGLHADLHPEQAAGQGIGTEFRGSPGASGCGAAPRKSEPGSKPTAGHHSGRPNHSE